MNHKNIKKVIVFDLETKYDEVNNKAEVMVWGIKEFGEDIFVKWGDANSFVNYLEKTFLDKNDTDAIDYYFYAHNFANFDNTYFVKEIIKKVKEENKLNDKKAFEIFQEEINEAEAIEKIYQQNKKVFIVKWYNLTFLCSWLLFRVSLFTLMNEEEKQTKELGDTFNWKDISIWSKKKKEIEKYLINDVKSLERILTEHFDRFPWSLGVKTLGSMALKHAIRLNPNIITNGTWGRLYNKRTQKIDEVKNRAFYYARKACRGTCVNYWNTRIGTYETLSYADVNSMYPAVYTFFPMPWGKPTIFKSKNIKIVEAKPLSEAPKDYFGFVEVEFNGYIKEDLFPFVASSKSHSQANPRYESGYYFPKHLKGTFIWFTPWFHFIKERYEARNGERLCRIREIHHYKKSYPFTKYSDFWMKEKIRAKKKNDVARYNVAKAMLNSLFGKFGQNIFNKDDTLRNCFNYQPILASVLAYARIKLYSAIEKISYAYGKDKLLYSDTDCIWLKNLTRKDIEKVLEVDDTALGKWKVQEYKNATFEIYAPKAYVLNGKMRWKGAYVEKYELPHMFQEIINSQGKVLLPTRKSKVLEDGRVIYEEYSNFYLNQYRKQIQGNSFIEYNE